MRRRELDAQNRPGTSANKRLGSMLIPVNNVTACLARLQTGWEDAQRRAAYVARFEEDDMTKGRLLHFITT
jgi:hypothetical protein